jgi:hypothetical protein
MNRRISWVGLVLVSLKRSMSFAAMRSSGSEKGQSCILQYNAAKPLAVSSIVIMSALPALMISPRRHGGHGGHGGAELRGSRGLFLIAKRQECLRLRRARKHRSPCSLCLCGEPCFGCFVEAGRTHSCPNPALYPPPSARPRYRQSIETGSAGRPWRAENRVAARNRRLAHRVH